MRVKEHLGAFHFALDVGRPYRAVADDARSAGPPMGPGDTLGDGGQAALRQACLYLPPQCIVGGAGPSPLDGRPVLRTYDVSIKHPGALATHAGSSVACILNREDQAKCHRVVALRRASETRSRPVHCAPPARPFLAGPWSRPSTSLVGRLGLGLGRNRPCRHTDDRRGGRDILGNHGTSAHNRPIADM